MEILGPKRKSKDIEAPLQDIEHQKLMPIDFDERGRKKEQQESIAYIFPVVVKPPAGFLGVYPSSRSLLGNRPYGIPKVFFHFLLSLANWVCSPNLFYSKLTSTESTGCSGRSVSVSSASGSIHTSPSGAFGLAGVVPPKVKI